MHYIIQTYERVLRTGKCFPRVTAEVYSMLAGVVRPMCHLRPRCRHDAYVILGNAHGLGLLNWPKGGLLDVIFDAQFQNFVLAVCDVWQR